jgi:5,10-methylenetetrahydromethanopterin reductase
MRIGIVSGGRRETLSFDKLIRQVVQAEEDGFDSFWFVQLPTLGYDALTVISLAGRQTSRIELGTAVIPIYTMHPLALAKQALTTQSATGGRFSLGIGVSHRPVVENIMGMSYEGPARYMQEYLSVLRPLVDKGQVAFSGQRFSVTAELQVQESSPFPVLIAALAPIMLRTAGELADGTITWMAGVRTIETHVAPRIKAAAEKAGRPQPRICASLPVAVTDDPQSARDRAAEDYQRYGQLVNYRRMLDIEGVEGPSEIAIVGNEAQVEQQLRAMSDAGTTDFVASIFPVGDDAEASEARTWALLKSLVGKI